MTWLPVFANKITFEYIHACAFTHWLWLLFPTGQTWVNCNRDYISKYLWSNPSQENFTDPCTGSKIKKTKVKLSGSPIESRWWGRDIRDLNFSVCLGIGLLFCTGQIHPLLWPQFSCLYSKKIRWGWRFLNWNSFPKSRLVYRRPIREAKCAKQRQNYSGKSCSGRPES